MKTFAIEGDLNPGSWFYFDEKDESTGVKIRVMNQTAMNEMTSATRKFTVEYKSSGRGKPKERFEFYKPIENAETVESEMMHDYSVVDWKGIVDSTGAEIPCTKENKVKLMQGSIDFFRFVSARNSEYSRARSPIKAKKIAGKSKRSVTWIYTRVS